MCAETAFNAYTKEDWWDESGRLSSLHLINPQRFEYFSLIAEKATGGLKGKTILDIGCGGGVLAEEYAKAGALVTGIDLSPVAIEAAKEHAAESALTINYRIASVEELCKENCSYDIISCTEVLEHVDDVPTLINDSASMLKKGGLYFFSTINRTLMARFFAVFMAEDVLQMLPQGTHDYSRFLKPSELTKILERSNVSVEEIKGMSLDVLSRSFKISKDTSINYLGYGVKR